MQKRKRKKYTDEFKEEAVKLVTEQQYKVTEAARNLDIHHSLLRRWIKGCSPGPKSVSGEMVKLKAEVKQLKRDNEKLRMEREILKKAAAFFAKEVI